MSLWPPVQTWARRLVERFGVTGRMTWLEMNRRFLELRQQAEESIVQIAGLGIVRSRAAAMQAQSPGRPELSTAAVTRQRSTGPDQALVTPAVH